ncbi:MAG: HAD hydrolase family protein [Chloroflexota bacterium]|nr:HAD hydrolase family protein [Chloroflexota bacterium]
MNYSKILADIKAIAFDFDGVFTDNRVYVMQNGEEAVACDRSDGMGISMLRKVGIPMIIISTEKNPVVGARGAKLNIDVLQGVEDKLPILSEWVMEKRLSIEQVAFIGNDINDVECLNAVGLGIVVADAYPVAVDAADLVLTKKGGHGAVREIADLWLSANKIITS